jgi:hypothetical protein
MGSSWSSSSKWMTHSWELGTICSLKDSELFTSWTTYCTAPQLLKSCGAVNDAAHTSLPANGSHKQKERLQLTPKLHHTQSSPYQPYTTLFKWITFTSTSYFMKLYFPNNLFFNYSYSTKYTKLNIFQKLISHHFQLYFIVMCTDMPSFIIYLTFSWEMRDEDCEWTKISHMYVSSSTVIYCQSSTAVNHLWIKLGSLVTDQKKSSY